MKSAIIGSGSLKRIDVTSRSLVAIVEPGSCFAGFLAEIVFAADRAYMLIGRLDGDNRPPAAMIADGGEFRSLSDGQWPDAARHALSRRTRIA